MAITITYIGTQDRWPELAVTGKQSVWAIGQTEERSDAEAKLLVATGKFSAAEVPITQNPATGGIPSKVAKQFAAHSISGDYFGFVPGADNTAAFANIGSYFDGLKRTERSIVTLKPGIYYADAITLQAFSTESQRGHLTIEGAGQYATVLKPNATSNPIFMQTGAGAFTGLVMRNLGIEGIGATNVGQHGFFLGGDMTPGFAHDGGVWNSLFEDVRIQGFDGIQSIVRGCNNDAMLPAQFLTFMNYWVYRDAGNHNPCQLMWGQVGQVLLSSTIFSGQDKFNNAGPNIWIARDPRFAGVSSSVASSLITTSNTTLFRNAQRVRVVGSSRPSTLDRNIDYYITGLLQTGSASTFYLATSAANAAAGTSMSVPDAGTPGSWFVVDADLCPVAVSTSTNVIWTSGAHLLFSGDQVRVFGANLPAPLAIGTDYYVIKTGDNALKLASSYANAQSGTAITLTTAGTIGDFGIAISSASNQQQPYAIDLINLTTQAAECGIFVDGAYNVHVSGYFERCKRALTARWSATVSLDHANFGVITDSGAGAIIDIDGACSVYVDAQSTITGAYDKLVKATGNGRVIWGSRFASSQFTTGNGIAAPWNGQTLQAGGSAANELNIYDYTNVLLSPSANIIKWIKSKLVVGEQFTARVWTGAPNYAEFDATGNIDLNGLSGRSMRFPAGSLLTFKLHDLGTSWTLANAQLPWHSATWTVSGNVAANSSITKTITTYGAKIGDPAPHASIDAALTAGLILTAEVTAADTTTVKITNPTAVALAGPTNPTVYVRQTR